MRSDDNNKKTEKPFMNIGSWNELCSNYAELYSLLIEPLRLPNPSVVWLIFIGNPFQGYTKKPLVLKF
jgi:hypothetical protein